MVSKLTRLFAAVVLALATPVWVGATTLAGTEMSGNCNTSTGALQFLGAGYGNGLAGCGSAGGSESNWWVTDEAFSSCTVDIEFATPPGAGQSWTVDLRHENGGSFANTDDCNSHAGYDITNVGTISGATDKRLRATIAPTISANTCFQIRLTPSASAANTGGTYVYTVACDHTASTVTYGHTTGISQTTGFTTTTASATDISTLFPFVAPVNLTTISGFATVDVAAGAGNGWDLVLQSSGSSKLSDDATKGCPNLTYSDLATLGTISGATQTNTSWSGTSAVIAKGACFGLLYRETGTATSNGGENFTLRFDPNVSMFYGHSNGSNTDDVFCAVTACSGTSGSAGTQVINEFAANRTNGSVYLGTAVSASRSITVKMEVSTAAPSVGQQCTDVWGSRTTTTLCTITAGNKNCSWTNVVISGVTGACYRLFNDFDQLQTGIGSTTWTVALDEGPTPTPTVTPTPTATTTPTPTVTATPTLTATPTNTLTPTPTVTLTPALTPTPTLTATPTATVTPTLTLTLTPTRSPTPTLTATPTATATLTPTKTATITPSPTRTATPTPSATKTATPTVTVTVTATPGDPGWAGPIVPRELHAPGSRPNVPPTNQCNWFPSYKPQGGIFEWCLLSQIIPSFIPTPTSGGATATVTPAPTATSLTPTPTPTVTTTPTTTITVTPIIPCSAIVGCVPTPTPTTTATFTTLAVIATPTASSTPTGTALTPTPTTGPTPNAAQVIWTEQAELSGATTLGFFDNPTEPTTNLSQNAIILSLLQMAVIGNPPVYPANTRAIATSLHCMLTSSPGDGRGWTFELRNSSGTTLLTCGIFNNAAQECTSTGSAGIAHGETLTIRAVPTGTMPSRFAHCSFDLAFHALPVVLTPTPTISSTPTASPTPTLTATKTPTPTATATQTTTPRPTPSGAIVFIQNFGPYGVDGDFTWEPVANELTVGNQCTDPTLVEIQGSFLDVNFTALDGSADQHISSTSTNFPINRRIYQAARGTCVGGVVQSGDIIQDEEVFGMDTDLAYQQGLKVTSEVAANPSPSYVPLNREYQLGGGATTLQRVLKLFGVTGHVEIPRALFVGLGTPSPTATPTSTVTATNTAGATSTPTITATPTATPTLTGSSPTPTPGVIHNVPITWIIGNLGVGIADSVARIQTNTESAIATGTFRGSYDQVDINPVWNSSATYVGFDSQLVTRTGIPVNFTGSVMGGRGLVLHRGAGTVASLLGASFQSVNGFLVTAQTRGIVIKNVGGTFQAINNTISGTNAVLAGGAFSAANRGSGAKVTDAYAGHFSVDNRAGATTDTMYGLRVRGIDESGSDTLIGGIITQGVMLSIGDWNSGPTYTNPAIQLQIEACTASNCYGLLSASRAHWGPTATATPSPTPTAATPTATAATPTPSATSTPLVNVNGDIRMENGHLTCRQATKPTISCSAGSPTVTDGSCDFAGQFVAGALATSCTVTFNRAYSNIPFGCVANGQSVATAMRVTPTRTTMVFTSATALDMAGATINWVCIGNE